MKEGIKVTKISRQTATFYGDKEIEIARQFAEKAKGEFGSVNRCLKALIKDYLKNKERNEVI